MLRKLTVDQINDWFTIGKTVTNVELLGLPPAFPAEAAREEALRPDAAPGDAPVVQAQVPGPVVATAPARPASASGRSLSQRSSEMEYINKYRQLEAQELDMYGQDQPPSGPGLRSPLAKLSNVTCISETTYKYPDLPINRCKEEVISLIESNSVVIIHGATGSGKSTQLPQYILDHYAQRSAFCNIVVTQPRKIGASSIARWISKERSWTLGGLVGYQVGLEKIATEDTRLIYMTTGVLLQKIVSAKSLMEFTHVFIDEVHERTEEMDFLLLVVRKLLRTNSRFVKVILMSATINCKEFADYFAVPVQNKMNPAYVFEVEGKPHTIEEYYLNDLGHIYHSGLPPYRLEEPVITKDVYEVAVSLIQMFDDLDMKESGNKTWSGTQFVSERSSVLVFLPGLGEINYMHELLTNMIHKRLQVYPLHSSVTLEEQNNVFLSPVPGYRKIILSTNIAESSVTVPDVKYVIDFCLTRTLVCDEDTNYQSLRLSWASKTSCDQRKGRAGRVSKGYCYRLIHRDFWDSSIPDHVVPEMLRCPLGSTILKVKLLDMGEPRALLATALSPPSLSDIERTILLLKEVGALAVSGQREDENPHDGELTFLGRVLAQLPVSQQLGKLIVLGHVFGCLDECLIIAAALSLKNFFTMPFRQHLDGYRNKVHFSGSSKSDCLALVEAFRAWQACRHRGELRHPKDELDWGRLNYIQIKRIREVAELYEELKNRISQFNMFVDPRHPVLDQEHPYKQRFILQVVLAGAFYPNYFTFGQPDEEMAVRELAGKDPKTTVVHCEEYSVRISAYPERHDSSLLVSLAVKMSQLKVPLELSVHATEEIEGKVQGGSVSKLRNTRVNVDFQKQTVDPMQVSFNTLDRPRTVADLLLTVDVTEVVEVGHFWGYRIDERNAELLKKLTAEINRLELVPLPVHPHPDLVCLAPFTDYNKESYFRAQILYVSGNSAEVFFVDYGNRSHVDLDLLREIPCQLLELPFQQSYEALKGFFAKSVESVPDASMSSPMKDDEKHLIRILLESFASNRLGAPNCKAVLHGPFNPYELKCHSLTRISKFRCVWIEKESINSVVISDSPADLHQRMLVAASLSVNETGSTMLLRETSLMPHIPGLPALLSMLFAPVMELRVGRDGKCYTGVLCGLGWNSTTEAPILPEHDIELAFDVCFTVEDIVEINILRAAINKLVCDGPNGSKYLGPERISQLQENARQKLLGLFCRLKPREKITPQWHEKPYEWNQVDPKLVMEQADQEGSRGKNTSLYQLHRPVVLSP
ncbi:putative ATP-dependent RNA helicase TDRD9 isoform 1 [Cricetulus griseus]|uniref:ATP-dependent RNA helicase TDRD9 n=1 Tax=Cricetulus griseus TaxID=10029 RepID=A0A061I0C3_CRIGR|nr:putative ATP-dependent RNA helicase TDRD9 isoform 1 [Cricetulus griseus]